MGALFLHLGLWPADISHNPPCTIDWSTKLTYSKPMPIPSVALCYLLAGNRSTVLTYRSTGSRCRSWDCTLRIVYKPAIHDRSMWNISRARCVKWGDTRPGTVEYRSAVLTHFVHEIIFQQLGPVKCFLTTVKI